MSKNSESPPVSLQAARDGALGPKLRVSHLVVAAARARFSGGLLIEGHALFFIDGAPAYAGGPAFHAGFLGEILLQKRLVPSSAIAAALDAQAKATSPPRPLLGELLVRQAGVPAEIIETGIAHQITARLAQMLQLESGAWQAAEGSNAEVQRLSLPQPALRTLVSALRLCGEQELKQVGRFLLGKAVTLKEDAALLDTLVPDAVESRALRYLAKPRKPDQLERAVEDRRAARALLRGLQLIGALELVPLRQAIPIPRATRIRGQTPIVSSPTTAPNATPSAAREPEPSPEPTVTETVLVELRTKKETIEDQNHFEVLGVPEAATTTDIRASFAKLAKKFHPDAYGQESNEELDTLLRDISARMNEAYRTLTDSGARAAYLEKLRQGIKDNSLTAEQLAQDAEMKATQARVAMRKHDYATARDYWRYAIAGQPDNAKFKASLAWAWFIDSKVPREEALPEAEALIKEALKTEKSADGLYYYGKILLGQERPKEARQKFQEALRADPRHTEAVREIRLIDRREKSAADAQKAKSLSKLFRRGDG